MFVFILSNYIHAPDNAKTINMIRTERAKKETSHKLVILCEVSFFTGWSKGAALYRK